MWGYACNRERGGFRAYSALRLLLSLSFPSSSASVLVSHVSWISSGLRCLINAEADKQKEPAEKALFDALKTTSRKADALFKQGDFTGYLKTFAVLRSPVDAFFESVMVMADAPELRHNRLALLADLRKEMNRIADISKLAV